MAFRYPVHVSQGQLTGDYSSEADIPLTTSSILSTRLLTVFGEVSAIMLNRGRESVTGTASSMCESDCSEQSV